MSVFVQIEKAFHQKVFSNLSILILHGASDSFHVSVKPKKVTVTIEASPEILEEVVDEDFQIFVDVSDLSPGEFDLPLGIRAPKDVQLIHYQPQVVQVKISTREEKLGNV